MHELLKLLHYAEATNVKFLRMGTCGGLGVKPGTLILTKSGFDGCLEKDIEIVALGQKKRYQADADPKFLTELTETLSEMKVPYEIGNTMTCNDFYETQGRLDGAFCEYSNDDKMSFIQKAHDEVSFWSFEFRQGSKDRLELVQLILIVTSFLVWYQKHRNGSIFILGNV